MTVTGPVASDSIGLTLTHEHLCNDIRAAIRPVTNPALAFLEHAPTSVTNAWLLREEPYACLDHCTLDGNSALEDLLAFGDLGGSTVVDVTPRGAGRQPEVLRSLSERSGVRVVMGTGWYLERFHPRHLHDTDERTLAADVVGEVENGVDGCDIAPGVIGEIGVSPNFTHDEQKALRAAARAQRETGLPLYVHLPGWKRLAHDVLDLLLTKYRVTPGAVVLCHMDPSGRDPDYQAAVAARGVWLEFDMIGMPYYFPGEGRSPSPDETAQAVAGLVRRGHAKQVLFSHDVFLKTMLRRFGGNGLSYVPLIFPGRLAAHGVPTNVTHDLLTRNPTLLFDAAVR